MPRESKRIYKFDGIRYWAEEGLITLYDEKDGTSRRIKPDDFLERATALGKQATREKHYREEQKFLNTADEMEKCAAEAIAQGDPSDPKVQQYEYKHGVYKKAYAQVTKAISEKRAPKKRGLIF